MGFNLTTFLAQIINLLLLIWLLKRFLYRPVLAIIEKRQQQIKHNIQEADNKLADAEQTQNALTKLKENFEATRQKRLQELDQEINQYKHQLMQELEKEFVLKQFQLQQDLSKSWNAAEIKIQQMIGAEFMTLTQKILTEWANHGNADQLLLSFDKKLHSCSASKKKQIQKILLQQKSIQMISAVKFNKRQQILLKNILHKYFKLPETIRFQFKHQADLIFGLEMRIGDFILDWSISSYLEQIKQTLANNISTLIVPSQQKVNK